MLSTPVLLIIFNRPDIVQQSFDQLKKVRPKQLFVAADGPRAGREDDKKTCADARKIIDQVDWPCEVKTLFREENRGCGYGPAEAITWFFGQVEEGIILEDDCKADVSFFYFCHDLLEKYKHDERISAISGTNQLKKWHVGSASYFFSKLGGNWGWATWKRAWNKFDFEARQWFTEEGKTKIRVEFQRTEMANHFSKEFNGCFTSLKGDVWDIQWLFCRILNGGLSIIPAVNLVSNIGFGAHATHTFNEKDRMANIDTISLSFPLKHTKVEDDSTYDWLVFRKYFVTKQIPLYQKALFKAISFLRERSL